MKVRRVDFYPDEWLAGTFGLTAAERGVYITLCALIYSHGGPIKADGLAKVCGLHGNAFRSIKSRLVELGKIFENAGEITVKRCEKELENARKRLENKKSRAEVNDLQATPTINHQLKQLPTNEKDAPAREDSEFVRSEEDFARFWEAYPSQVGEVAARLAFATAARKVEVAVLIAAVERYRASKPPDRQWLNPENWLNGERWLDRPGGLNGAGVAAAEPERRRPRAPPPERL
jgi:uncharacterized protein YdaU (DUF1376 family)